MPTTLDVLIHGQLAGAIRTNRVGDALFNYNDGYLSSADPVQLSVTIPLEDGDHNAVQWLDNLLPDNAAVRQRWQDKYGAPSLHPVDLLGTPIGRDCAGAVQFSPSDQTEAVLSRARTLVALDDSEVAQIIANLRLAGGDWVQNDEDWAFSLAGAQAKTALLYNDGKWFRPAGKTPTNRILKPAPARFPDLDAIEHVCLAAANLLNPQIPTARTECRSIGGERVLVVDRYDRAVLADGTLGRVHQEDLCQALGLPPAKKYQNKGGPTPKDIASLLRSVSSSPERDVRGFLDALIYNWVVVNPDAHSKNYSLFLTTGGAMLAPLYDICSILPYRNQVKDTPIAKVPLAMKVGKDYRIRKTDRRTAWERLAGDLGLPSEEVLERVADIASQTPDAVQKAAGTLPPEAQSSPFVGEFLSEVAARARKCARVPLIGDDSTSGSRAFALVDNGRLISEGTPTGAGSAIPPPASSRSARRERCPYKSSRTGKRCVMGTGHASPHRYTR